MKPKGLWMFFTGIFIGIAALGIRQVIPVSLHWITLSLQFIGMILMLIYLIQNWKLIRQKR